MNSGPDPMEVAEDVKRELQSRFGYELPGDYSRDPELVALLARLADEARSSAERQRALTTLLGNMLRWQTVYIARQFPVLPTRDGMVKKVKPLHRLSERETAAYAFMRGIEYVVEECPLVAGNTQLKHKDAMNQLEASSPGTKASFYLGFLDRGAGLFAGAAAADLRPCEQCDQPTTGRFCAFCRARAQILGESLAPPTDREVVAELSDEAMPAELYGR